MPDRRKGLGLLAKTLDSEGVPALACHFFFPLRDPEDDHGSAPPEIRRGPPASAGGPLSSQSDSLLRYGSVYALMSAPPVEKCENETMYSLPPTEYGVSLGSIGRAWPFTRTGICQSGPAPVLES